MKERGSSSRNISVLIISIIVILAASSILGFYLGRLYVDDTITQRVKDSLKEEHQHRHRAAKHDATYLAAEVKRLNDQIDLMYQDRLERKVSAERFTRLQEATLARIAECEAKMATARTTNAAYQEQGSTILDLLKGFKRAFVEADILQVLLKKATLRGKEWEFEFAQPFDVLFSIGELYFKKRRWGE